MMLIPYCFAKRMHVSMYSGEPCTVQPPIFACITRRSPRIASSGEGTSTLSSEIEGDRCCFALGLTSCIHCKSARCSPNDIRKKITARTTAAGKDLNAMPSRYPRYPHPTLQARLNILAKNEFSSRQNPPMYAPPKAHHPHLWKWK